MLSNNIHDYRIVSQGKTQIPGVDDAAEWVLIDVRLSPIQLSLFIFFKHLFKTIISTHEHIIIDFFIIIIRIFLKLHAASYNFKQ